MATRVKHRANTRHIAGMLQLASQADIIEGQHWYQRAYDLGVRLIHAYDGLTLGQAVGVIAALSPNNKWERNCQDAERLIKVWHHGGDLSAVKVCTYNTNKAKAISILELESVDTEAIDKILNGRKITAFYRSIMGDTHSVCVDGHTYAVWIGERVPTTKTPSLSPGLYDAIARSYILVAERSVELCGRKLTPAEVQAITWVTYRRLIK
jgi:hypothetical protein